MKQNFFNLPEGLAELGEEVCGSLTEAFRKRDEITEYNQLKMLSAFIKNGVAESHFAASTGYGYGDRGREVLERVFADAMGAEDALLRHNFMSGTHTLTVALFGVLRPGDHMLSITGRPYDTIHGVIGIGEESCPGSLKEFGIGYRETELTAEGKIDLPAVLSEIGREKPKMVYIQRSRGYTTRPSLTVEEIGEAARAVKEIYPDIIVMVDNCYGEFVETTEPTEQGADLIAGSLIKNPGGGIAPTGGYIAGRADLVEMCACRLTTPSTGKEIGATLGLSRELFLGVYNAPTVTGEAVKSAMFAAALFEKLGFGVSPRAEEKRADIIQTILLGTPEGLVDFCRGIQKGSPVDSAVTPEAWEMPGYDSKVIMAAGAFTNGSSIELSADAPMREPYAVWMQGGTIFSSAKMSILLAAAEMLRKGRASLPQKESAAVRCPKRCRETD